MGKSTRLLIDDYRNGIWGADELSAGAKLVGLAYGEFMDWHTLGNARPGIARIMKMTAMPRRSVSRALAELRKTTWLIEAQRGCSKKGQPRLASVYRGNIPTSATLALVKPTSAKSNTGLVPKVDSDWCQGGVLSPQVSPEGTKRRRPSGGDGPDGPAAQGSADDEQAKPAERYDADDPRSFSIGRL